MTFVQIILQFLSNDFKLYIYLSIGEALRHLLKDSPHMKN